MPDTLTATRLAETAPVHPLSSGGLPSGEIRWGRVAAVAIAFLLGFYSFEHNASQFAGADQGVETREDRIKDEYIDNIETGNSTRKLILVSYGLAGLIALSRCQSRPWNVRWLGALLLGSLFLWAMLSFRWSDEPALTLRRLAAACLVLVGSLGFARMLRPNELLGVTLVTFSGFVGYSLLADVAAGGKPWQIDYRFAGTVHPNIQAAYCGVLCLAAFSLPVGFGKRWIPRALLVFGFVMLIQTQSRTGALAVLAGLLMVFLVRLGPRVRWTAAFGLASVVGVGVMVLSSLGDGGRRRLTNAVLLGRTEQAGSLTGRVPLWQELSNYAADRPVTGYGYETFWTPDRIDAVMKTQEWALQSSHNAYFEITLQLGFVGLALAVPFILTGLNLLQSAYALTKNPGYAFAYGVIAFAMVNSLLESHFAKLKYPTVIALIALLGVVFFFPQQPAETATTGPAADPEPAAA